MRVYLVQHGESVPEELDPTRPLTAQGKANVEILAQFLKKAGVKIDVIWHSTKLRAKQTAQLLEEVLLPYQGILEKQRLNPNDPVGPVKEKIVMEGIENLMIVGHLPFLSKLVSLFLTDTEARPLVHFKEGGILALEQSEKGNWEISWMMVPDLLKHG